MRKFSKYAALAMLVMSSVSAQEGGSKKSESSPESKNVANAETISDTQSQASATASISIVTVDGDGKVTKKTITQTQNSGGSADSGEQNSKGKEKNAPARKIEVRQTDNKLEVILPDGTKQMIELGGVLKNRVDGVFELRLDEAEGEDGQRIVQGVRIQGIPDTGKLSEMLALQLSKLKETQEQIAKEGGEVAEQQAQIAAELTEKIAKAIKIEIGGEDGPQIAKFGKMFFLDEMLGDNAEMQVEVELNDDGTPAIRRGQRVISRVLQGKGANNEASQIEEKILDKLEAVLERLEKIEREIETLKSDRSEA